MVEVGDRIRLSSTKGPDREGLVTAVTGSLVRVRWPSGDETTVAPAPGTLSVLAAAKAAPKVAKKSAAKNTAGVTKKKAASKSAPKKTAAKKTKRA
jgi:topoisomerase IA-like protein